MKELNLENEETNLRKKISDKVQAGEIDANELEKPIKRRRRWDQPKPVSSEPVVKKSLLAETPVVPSRWGATPAHLPKDCETPAHQNWDSTPASLDKLSETPGHLTSWGETPAAHKRKFLKL